MSAPDIFSPEFARDPYPFYKIMREQYPLFYHEAGKTWVLSRFEDVERALKDPVFSSENYAWQIEPVHGRTIVQMEGKEHSTHRGLITPALRGRDFQELFFPLIEKNARELIDTFRDRGEVNLIDEFSAHFAINVMVEMLGLSRADHARFHAWYQAIVAFFSNLAGDPAVVELGLRTRKEITEYILPIIAERRRSPGRDLLSTLCAAEIDGARLTDDEIRSFVSLLIGAAGETTDRAVGSVFKNLIEHPDQLSAVRADRSLVDKVFAETLRYSPPVHMILRMPLEDVAIAGGVVPARSTVMCVLASANRDEKRYAAPDRFDIFRKDLDVARAFSGAADHAAFAFGRHFCVGSILAKTEVHVATNLLLDAMNDIRFAEGSPEDVGLFTRGPKSLKLRFSPAAATPG